MAWWSSSKSVIAKILLLAGGYFAGWEKVKTFIPYENLRGIRWIYSTVVLLIEIVYQFMTKWFSVAPALSTYLLELPRGNSWVKLMSYLILVVISSYQVVKTNLLNNLVRLFKRREINKTHLWTLGLCLFDLP